MSNILKSGDVVRFIRIDDPARINGEPKIFQGIILSREKDLLAGDLMYSVLCDDNIVRIFGDYEAIEKVCLINSNQ